MTDRPLHLGSTRAVKYKKKGLKLAHFPRRKPGFREPVEASQLVVAEHKRRPRWSHGTVRRGRGRGRRGQPRRLLVHALEALPLAGQHQLRGGGRRRAPQELGHERLKAVREQIAALPRALRTRQSEDRDTRL